MVKYRHKWSYSKTLSILSHVQHSGSDALVHKLFINDYNKKKLSPLHKAVIRKLNYQENLGKKFPT